jgi:hypothetical protein
LVRATAIRAAAIRIPGINPLRNSLAIDTLVIRAYNTIGTEGGITTPMPPALAIRAAENSGSYFLFLSSGINGVPIAAVVAAPEPEIAAKKA